MTTASRRFGNLFWQQLVARQGIKAEILQPELEDMPRTGANIKGALERNKRAEEKRVKLILKGMQ